MSQQVSDIAFTPSVKDAQSERGSREMISRWEQTRDFADHVTPELASFIAERDSFYLGTSSVAGQPYIQHRGGPRGFLKVLDEKTLAFADYRGNRQYVTTGNLDENDRAFLFLMDYPTRRRMKIWGRAEVVADDAALLASVVDADYAGKPEQVIRFTVEAWDANCPQHITPRFNEEELEPRLRELRERVAQLESENRALRQLSTV